MTQLAVTRLAAKMRRQAIRATELMREARLSAEGRGHSLAPFLPSYAHTWNTRCTRCGRGVWVTTKPMPNEIDICGEAVALGCN